MLHYLSLALEQNDFTLCLHNISKIKYKSVKESDLEEQHEGLSLLSNDS